MFYTQKNDSMENVIASVVPKTNTMAHRMSLMNRILCVEGISIFGFKKYWKIVFNLMNIKTTPTVKQILQAKILNAEKTNSYYQLYDVKILRALHKQEMIKQNIYKNILSRKIGMYCSPEIQFQTSRINMDEAKALTMNNQAGKSTDKKNGAGVFTWSTYISPQRNALLFFLPKRKRTWRWVFLDKR